MTAIKFTAMPTATARALRAGDADANGQPAERHVSDGDGVPCRHCLSYVGKDVPFLIAAYRPFPAPQPYAETGPIFLHAEDCARWRGEGVPPVLAVRPYSLIRGYGPDDRIVYGTGRRVAAAELGDAATDLLRRADVAYVHVRSADNSCFTCRIDRA